VIDVPYTEIAPPADLAAYVDRFWLRTTLRGDPSRVHRVLPDGCVDVIVRVDRATARLVGTMTRALIVADGPVEVIAVRFRPGTAAAVARCALDALTDREVEVAALGIAPGVAAQIAEQPTSARRIAVLVAWLRAHLAHAPRPDPRIAHAVARLSGAARDARVARIDDVARELGVSRQHLARAFRREVGISPKALARIARMQRAAAALGRGDAPLARLAVELGYFDQAHLANEIRALSGLSPRALAAAPSVALAHLYDR
jgi:AraC-like DNA-binding protein